MAETYGQHAAGTITMQVAVFCMNSEELEYVYEDMRMMLEQASQEIYVMRGSGD